MDASVVLAVLANEPERMQVISVTRGKDLAAPGCLGYEIGNAISAMMKRSRIPVSEAVHAYHEFVKVPIRLLSVDFPAALMLSAQYDLYAYDAYYLVSAQRFSMPLCTLDQRMAACAEDCGISVVEV